MIPPPPFVGPSPDCSTGTALARLPYLAKLGTATPPDRPFLGLAILRRAAGVPSCHSMGMPGARRPMLQTKKRIFLSFLYIPARGKAGREGPSGPSSPFPHGKGAVRGGPQVGVWALFSGPEHRRKMDPKIQPPNVVT